MRSRTYGKKEEKKQTSKSHRVVGRGVRGSGSGSGDHRLTRKTSTSAGIGTGISITCTIITRTLNRQIVVRRADAAAASS